MSIMRRHFISAFAAILAVGFIAGPALAGGAVNKTLFGTALKGYDAVAYHTVGRPVEGSPRISYRWRGANWHFASVEHRDLFAADPERYAPAYGGYCAYGMAQGAKIDIDPSAWSIVDGKLHLNVNKRVQLIWNKDISGYIVRANGHWRKLMG